MVDASYRAAAITQYWFGTYERGLAGLWHCYVAAIPFFRYTLTGDMIFAVVLFGGYALATSLRVAREPAAQAMA